MFEEDERRRSKNVNIQKEGEDLVAKGMIEGQYKELGNKLKMVATGHDTPETIE